jgi:hypothetical protein
VPVSADFSSQMNRVRMADRPAQPTLVVSVDFNLKSRRHSATSVRIDAASDRQLPITSPDGRFST